jgi:hypothetical protein
MSMQGGGMKGVDIPGGGYSSCAWAAVTASTFSRTNNKRAIWLVFFMAILLYAPSALGFRNRVSSEKLGF